MDGVQLSQGYRATMTRHTFHHSSMSFCYTSNKVKKGLSIDSILREEKGQWWENRHIINGKSTFKVLNFAGTLFLNWKKNYILQVFNFAIWRLQNISQVFNFVISVKIRKESLIKYQFLYCLSM